MNSYNYHGPRALPNISERFIAPYWADVDTTEIGQIYYRQTNKSALLARATSEIQRAFTTSENLNVTNLLIVTWDTVGYYDRHMDKVRFHKYVT